MTLGFLSGSRKFCKLLWFLVKFLFRTDMPGSIGWLSPAPRLRIDDCFEIRNCRLGPCDLLLSKSPKFAARGTASPLRLLHGGPCNFGPFADLAISVFGEMSMNTMFAQILTSLEYGLQRGFMRRTGVRISLYWNFVIPQNFP